MEAKGSPELTGLNWLATILFNMLPKAAAESLKYTQAQSTEARIFTVFFQNIDAPLSLFG